MTEPVVETTSGKVRGFTSEGILAFRGIPYGAPPVGRHRWKAPTGARTVDGGA